MERIELNYPATANLPGKAVAGVVGSGDLEALFEPNHSQQLSVTIKTTVDGSQLIWQRLFDRLSQLRTLPAGTLILSDFGATPGVVRLRIEQVFEEAGHAE